MMLYKAWDCVGFYATCMMKNFYILFKLLIKNLYVTIRHVYFYYQNSNNFFKFDVMFYVGLFIWFIF